MASPYDGLPASRFWRSAVAGGPSDDTAALYAGPFPITADDRIVTAGSCFAQHIARRLRDGGFQVLDYEPPPPGITADLARRFGYEIYSARYGNIYAPRQLLQLAEDAASGQVDERDFWIKDGRIHDALRPGVEPNGFETLAEAVAHRRWHLANVARLFADMSVFIFTFGLTEAWLHKETGRVYPTAPGTIAGAYDKALHVFHNFSYPEIYDDFVRFHEIVRARNPDVRMVLTVSPVPLTATASEDHVLVANTYSKSVLRAAAGELSRNLPGVGYFPAYEIVAGHPSRGRFYEDNLRSVTAEGVGTVMAAFMAAHGEGATRDAAAAPAPAESAANGDGDEDASAGKARRRALRAERKARRQSARRRDGRGEGDEAQDDAVCEEILLEGFAPRGPDSA
jgi:hypothetical protein